jgi:hypothetical protein
VHPEAVASVFTAMKSLDHLLIKFSSKPPLLDRLSANWLHTRSRLLQDFTRLNDDVLLKDFQSSFPPSIHEFSVSSLEFRLLKQSCCRIKRLLNALLALRLRQHQIDSIKLHTEQHDANFIDNKKQFLSSTLNREFRCIVLDRVLTFSNPLRVFCFIPRISSKPLFSISKILLNLLYMTIIVLTTFHLAGNKFMSLSPQLIQPFTQISFHPSLWTNLFLCLILYFRIKWLAHLVLPMEC